MAKVELTKYFCDCCLKEIDSKEFHNVHGELSFEAAPYAGPSIVLKWTDLCFKCRDRLNTSLAYFQTEQQKEASNG